jgi:contractile injection system tube protein
MTIPAKGTLLVQTGPASFEDIEVQYNPTELQFEKQSQLAEITIPGLDAPLQQFVRGAAEKLSLELFCDTTDDGMGVNARSVTRETDKFYALTKIVPELHATPVVTFHWHDMISGATLGEAWGSQRRNSFTGIAESVRCRFTLFSPEGVPLRATVNLVLREWRPLEEQLKQLKLSSPDRTHRHELRAGETLSAVATRYYDDPGNWRPLLDPNAIDDPRRLAAGTVLAVPALRPVP